jgi:hypothetical protein
VYFTYTGLIAPLGRGSHVISLVEPLRPSE